MPWADVEPSSVLTSGSAPEYLVYVQIFVPFTYTLSCFNISMLVIFAGKLYPKLIFFNRKYDPSSNNRLLCKLFRVLPSSYLGTSVTSPGSCQRLSASTD